MAKRSEKNYVSARFIFQAFGSWFVAPLGFLIAQVIGQGANKHIYLYLLITSLSAGIGLFLNEILAPQETRRRSGGKLESQPESLSLLLLICLLLGYFYVYDNRLADGNKILPCLLTFATAVSTWFSYKTSRLLCTSLMDHAFKVSKRFCLTLGALPALCSQIFIVTVSMLGKHLNLIAGSLIVCLWLLLPSLLVYLFARIYLIDCTASDYANQKDLERSFTGEAIIIVLLLAATSYLVTILKSSVANSFGAFSNLGFIALNILSTAVMVATKSRFMVSYLNTSESNKTFNRFSIYCLSVISLAITYFLMLTPFSDSMSLIAAVALILFGAGFTQLIIFYARRVNLARALFARY